VVIAGVSCDQSSSTEPSLHEHAHAAPAVGSSPNAVAAAGLTKAVHAAAARFHSTQQAIRAGYAADPFCVEAPPGGMGHHWLNGALVDDVFDAMNPEAVLYAPDKHGRLQLIAVEYLVLDVGQPAPTFAGQAFDVGGAPIPVPHWTLHVWLYKPNPSGLFAPFNPDVDCP
jgi:hypothetical protein